MNPVLMTIILFAGMFIVVILYSFRQALSPEDEGTDENELSDEEASDESENGGKSEIDDTIESSHDQSVEKGSSTSSLSDSTDQDDGLQDQVAEDSGSISGEDSESTPSRPPNEELELPFEPIHTFDPDSNQFSTLYSDLHKKPWPDPVPTESSDYDDRGNPENPSVSLERAITMLVESNTETLHQNQSFNKFINLLKNFIEEPRAVGAEYIIDKGWRDEQPHLSRLIGDRLIVMALGLSSYGNVEMNQHMDAVESLLSESWNEDDFEQPLLYQCCGRLALLSPTDVSSIQKTLLNRIAGHVPGRNGEEKIQRIYFNSLLFATCSMDEYPFPRNEKGLSRLWHWDEHNPPLAEWDSLQPIFYSLWIHNWVKDEPPGAEKDLGALFGNWWDENAPSKEVFNNDPATWESLLMLAWGHLPDHPMIWDQIRDRYNEMEVTNEQIINISEGYFEWVDHYNTHSERPFESFVGHRLPPTEWIKPLPSDLLNEGSKPSFDFPESWCEQLGIVDIPDIKEL